MKARIFAIAAVSVAGALAVPLGAQAQAQTSSAPASSAAGTIVGPSVTVQVASITGKVTAIDRAQRLVTLKSNEGRVSTLFVGPEIRNFDNLKVGDEVTLGYSEAHSLALAKGEKGNEARLGELRVKIEADAARQAPPGGKPGLSTMERTTLVANVFEIDRQRGILTLRGTDGVPVDIRVPDKQSLSQIGLNDQVIIGYRRAAVVSIQPGAAGGQAGAASGASRAGASAPGR